MGIINDIKMRKCENEEGKEKTEKKWKVLLRKETKNEKISRLRGVMHQCG